MQLIHAPIRSRHVPPPVQETPETGRLILRDGSTAELRPAKSEDYEKLIDFFAGLSLDARRHRFLSVSLPDSGVVQRLVEADDPCTGLTLIATRLHEGRSGVIATGSYFASKDQTAEVAIAVADEFLGKGLGTLLLDRLARIAVQNGFTRLWCLATSDDAPMLDVLRSSGFAVAERPDKSGIEIVLNVAATAASVVGQETRDAEATVASLRPFFTPNSVAVVGVSRNVNSVGRHLLAGLRSAGFAGSIYPVNPNVSEIDGLKCYASLREIPGKVDMAIIVVPAAAVLPVVEDCGARGVRALVVISAGFAEIGPAGAALQDSLVAKVRGSGMRMIGPNCLGVLNADPAVRLNATFVPTFPPSGKIAMSAQSGAVGLAALHAARRSGLGFSSFVSVGNKADVSGNDLLQYWERDSATDVILLYLESFGNPRRFARIARRVSRTKPIVVLHSGLTRAGGRAAGSHTAALASKANAVEALFGQTGVIRAESLEEMFDLALLLGSQPLPLGRRVGIVTNAGGPAILCADECEAGGLSVPELSRELREKLTTVLPNGANIGNPTDLIAGAAPETYRRAVEAMLTSGEVDALITIFTPVGLCETSDVMKSIGDGLAAARRAGSNVPLLACLVGPETDRSQRELAGEKVPCFPFPELPARALGKVAKYAEWRNRPSEVFPEFDDLKLDVVRDVCRKALETRGSGWLSVEEVQCVLKACGLPVVPTVVARTEEEAVSAAASFGYPVTVKLASRLIVHKTEVGGVKLGLRDADDVRRACHEIRSGILMNHKPEAMDGLIVQPMLSGGTEVMAGVTSDSAFGPLVAFGIGGVLVEVLADVSFRAAPLTDRDAAELVRGIRGFRLLEGYRNHAPADLDALENLLLRVSRLAEEIPEIGEIDLNPVIALRPGEGCRIADARIHVHSKSKIHSPIRPRRLP